VLARLSAPSGGGLVVAFDAEDSGRAAAARANPVLRAAGIWPTAADLPEGTDSAALARGRGRRALRAALSGAAAHPLVEVAVAGRGRPLHRPAAHRGGPGERGAGRRAPAGHRPG
jgi:hypothetical protein